MYHSNSLLLFARYVVVHHLARNTLFLSQPVEDLLITPEVRLQEVPNKFANFNLEVRSQNTKIRESFYMNTIIPSHTSLKREKMLCFIVENSKL